MFHGTGIARVFEFGIICASCAEEADGAEDMRGPVVAGRPANIVAALAAA